MKMKLPCDPVILLLDLSQGHKNTDLESIHSQDLQTSQVPTKDEDKEIICTSEGSGLSTSGARPSLQATNGPAHAPCLQWLLAMRP